MPLPSEAVFACRLEFSASLLRVRAMEIGCAGGNAKRLEEMAELEMQRAAEIWRELAVYGDKPPGCFVKQNNLSASGPI